MGIVSISKELLVEWQILSKLLRSLLVLDRSTHWLICTRHKSIKKHILSYLNANDTMRTSSKQLVDEAEYMRNDFLLDIIDSFIYMNTSILTP